MSLPQTNLVNFDKIQQKKIRDYIQDRGLSSKADFDTLSATSYKPAEKDTYLVHCKKFAVDADVKKVWTTYLTIPPRDTWKGKMVSFGCMYSKNNGQLTYLNDAYEGLKEGQILFLNIGLLWGMVNIAVAHQITRVNLAEKYIEFSYIEGGETEGSQRLLYHSNEDGTTTVTHRTTYRGKTRSFIREKVLYPFLHGRVIAAFHRNVRREILKSEAS